MCQMNQQVVTGAFLIKYLANAAQVRTNAFKLPAVVEEELLTAVESKYHDILNLPGPVYHQKMGKFFSVFNCSQVANIY